MSLEESEEDPLVTVSLPTGDYDIPEELHCNFLLLSCELQGYAPLSLSVTLTLPPELLEKCDEERSMWRIMIEGLDARAAADVVETVRAIRCLRLEEFLRPSSEGRVPQYLAAVPPVTALGTLIALSASCGASITVAEHLHHVQSAVCDYFEILCDSLQPSVADFSALLCRTEVLPRVYCIHVESQVVLASMFLRFQEYYESPAYDFRKKLFTLEQYKAWYKETKQAGPKGGFDYYLRWPGFNVPSWVIRDALAGKLGSLLVREKALLDSLPGDTAEEYYVIGTCAQRDESTLEHEMAHGLFFTNQEYRQEVKALLQLLPAAVQDVMRQSLLAMGYVDDLEIIIDEFQAYLCEGQTLGAEEATSVGKQVRSVFDKFVAAAKGH